MDFTLTDGQKKLVSAFRTFGADTFTPERVAKWCRDQGLPDTVMKEFVDLYYETAEPDIAPDLAHSLLSQVLIVEELSRCAGTTLPFQNDLFNLQIMSGFAGAAEAASIAEDYRADGRLMFALAISEPDGGSDTMAMKTSCQTVDGRLLLNGRKSYVNNGEYAPYILVAAIDKDAGDTGRYPSLSFWLVPRSVPGINAVPISKIGQSMLPFALISFDDVELSPEWRLDASEGGFQQLFHLLEYGRVLLCASSLGMAQAAMDDAVAHARSRKAFGVQVGRFQQIETLLTDMEVRLRNMRSMVYRAAWSIDARRRDRAARRGSHEALRAGGLGAGGLGRHADSGGSRLYRGLAREPHLGGLPRQPDRRGNGSGDGLHRRALDNGTLPFLLSLPHLLNTNDHGKLGEKYSQFLLFVKPINHKSFRY